ncbi:class C beta-lactamase [Methylobacterium thuringiense]|uniref:class C beta-lactamase n=1 Tax=Methylobacterium thuringiense TaxID=1003091 RepID=UPI001EE0BFF2|nr:class C beta-lactamase [Methylobacterium thuringiense]
MSRYSFIMTRAKERSSPRTIGGAVRNAAGLPLILAARRALIAAACLLGSVNAASADGPDGDRIRRIVTDVIRPLMAENAIPGMAVGVVVGGRRHVVNLGVANKETGGTVTGETLFELGSVSKTFTATLAAYAQATGALSFSEAASKHLPALAGSAFDGISLLDLGTYTAGGLPLQFPDAVTSHDGMIAFYRGWRPRYAPGTHRLYANTSIGLFGFIAAASMRRPFGELLEGKLFPALGLSSTFVTVPPARMGDYAYGYAKDDKPVRVAPGMLDSEAYGIKTTAGDMLRFVEANIDPSGLDDMLGRAIRTTQTGYFKLGGMVQGLGWEMYADPADLDTLLAGNAAGVILEANPVVRLDPPLSPNPGMLLDKTGSTNGFGAYVAFVPAKRIGLVMLANRNYPIPNRVKAAHKILSALDGPTDAARAP